MLAPGAGSINKVRLKEKAMMDSAPQGQPRPPRRYDIDWLRVLATLAVFLFHCARFFNAEDWHVKNNVRDLPMSVFVSFLSIWIMPILFLLSGQSSFFGLNIRTSGRYISERVKRLVIPFVGGTLIILVPLQVYFERVQRAQFTGSFLEFYPHYFDGFYALGGNFAWMGLHLWFLGYLFIISLISLPFFLYLKTASSQGQLAKIAAFIKKPGAILLFAVPLIIVELLVNLSPHLLGSRAFGGWSLVQYLMFFNYGYLLASDQSFQEAAERESRIALLLGLAASAIYIYIFYGFILKGEEAIPYYLGYVIRGVFRPFCSWFLLVAIIGYGGKYLKSNSRLLQYANEAVLPFYILHQTVIVTLGFYLADWSAGVAVKYLVISTSAFIIVVGLYQVIERVGWLRFFFGMKR